MEQRISNVRKCSKDHTYHVYSHTSPVQHWPNKLATKNTMGQTPNKFKSSRLGYCSLWVYPVVEVAALKLLHPPTAFLPPQDLKLGVVHEILVVTR
ncbi:hypothetical protein CT0861_07550 [Colletotrichum tofieldiae]|uniref:Uncharacterized protein n=1 Tax=Colletotrichum tofieldiae TaxID=708197 RepID=A0A166UII3_9PEZI|nr:hypothetical protein CT0861_07550 [Colletotrichum tofieldiae]